VGSGGVLAWGGFKVDKPEATALVASANDRGAAVLNDTGVLLV
jgi:hypothetical protein